VKLEKSPQIKIQGLTPAGSSILAILQPFIIVVLMLSVLIACSKPPPESTENHNVETPSSADREQLQTPVDPAQAATPTQTTITKEELDGYASAFGVDAATAEVMLKKETAFWQELNEAIATSNQQSLSAMIEPHFARLQQTLSAYQPDPDGKLPQWWDEASSSEGINTVASRINQAGYLNLDRSNLVDQRIAYGSAANAAKARPELLDGMIASRINDAPSPLDAIVYQGILDGLADNTSYYRADSSAPNEDMPGSELVRKMATAKNPVYRLLAVEQAWLLNTEDRLSFYETFIAENDPRIKRNAIEGAANTKNANAVNTLRRFEQSSLQQGDKASAELASQAIKRLEAKSP